MFTEKDLTEICKNVCAAAGYDLIVPVQINKRLRTTLGRVKYVRRGSGRIDPALIEFSHSFLSLAKEEEIMEIIKHECAHYLVALETHEHHGHDAKFKEICKKINCHANTATVDFDSLGKVENFKYLIYCPSCNEIVAKYHRKGKVIQNLDACYCSRCKNYGLQLIQNW